MKFLKKQFKKFISKFFKSEEENYYGFYLAKLYYKEYEKKYINTPYKVEVDELYLYTVLKNSNMIKPTPLIKKVWGL